MKHSADIVRRLAALVAASALAASQLPAQAADDGSYQVASADCYAIGEQVAAQNGGTLAKVSAGTEGGQQVCVVVVLVPGKDGSHPRRVEVVVPAG